MGTVFFPLGGETFNISQSGYLFAKWIWTFLNVFFFIDSAKQNKLHIILPNKYNNLVVFIIDIILKNIIMKTYQSNRLDIIYNYPGYFKIIYNIYNKQDDVSSLYNNKY